MDIYGKYKEALEAVMAHTARQIENTARQSRKRQGNAL